MTPGQRETLLRIKMAVAAILGNVCAGCRGRFLWPWEVGDLPITLPTLQVNHVRGRKWSIRKVHRIQRWWRYLSEAIESIIRELAFGLPRLVEAMCSDCNRQHGARIRYKGPVDKSRQGQPRWKRRKGSP